MPSDGCFCICDSCFLLSGKGSTQVCASCEVFGDRYVPESMETGTVVGPQN